MWQASESRKEKKILSGENPHTNQKNRNKEVLLPKRLYGTRGGKKKRDTPKKNKQHQPVGKRASAQRKAVTGSRRRKSTRIGGVKLSTFRNIAIIERGKNWDEGKGIQREIISKRQLCIPVSLWKTK